MPPDPRIRASDRDRDRTAELLREHHAVGRLDPEEFNERLDRAFAAKTVTELDQLTADLPAIDLYPLPTASLPRGRLVNSGLPASSVRRADGRPRRWRGPTGWSAAWSGYGALFVVFVVLGIVGIPVPTLILAGIGLLMLTGQVVSRRAIGRGGSSARRLTDRHRDELGGSGDDKT